MELTIRHFIPGRVRLHAPALTRHRSLAEATLAWLKGRPGIRSTRINYDCACVIVEYDAAREAQLRTLIGRLRLISIQDLYALVAPGQSGAGEAAARRGGDRLDATQSLLRRVPLALPTLSVALAFSLNPVVRAINLPLMLWNAYPIALRAWRVWQREGRLNVDFLDTLAVTASLLQGNPMAGAIVTWLIKLGDWIRDLTAAGSRRAIRELLEFQVKTAYVVRDSVVVAIPSSALAVGDEVVVYPGGMIPIDGEIIAGQALIDQKTITGEGLPVTRGKGDAAFAATVVSDGHLTIRATRVGADTTAGQIVRLVESAPVGDTRMQNHAERLADRLVVPELVLATMTHAARTGIIIKSGRHLERLAEVDTIVFDKTGTLTHGTPAVLDVLT